MPQLNTLPAEPLPDLPIDNSPEYTVSETNYGDGYKIIAEDGINAAAYTVRLTWSNINDTERAALVDFLKAHAPAVPFFYTAHGHPRRTFTCRQWSEREVSAGYHRVSATLTEFHGASVYADLANPVVVTHVGFVVTDGGKTVTDNA